jgi:phosphoribosylformimino-5-aminoimidazole carboxamide ribotide isomerase
LLIVIALGMDLVLAMDLRHGAVVHGKAGNRTEYLPLDWGISTTSEPLRYIEELRPKNLYIADLDRIEKTGSHEDVIKACARRVSCCYVDRGICTPHENLKGDNIVNVIGTETCGDNLSRYKSGFLSLDIKHGKVIPSGRTPVDLLVEADRMGFEGCIILNLGAVGTQKGIDQEHTLRSLRSAYSGKLLYGGGVATTDDLHRLADAGFDGAIIATAVHQGKIPLSWVQEGCMC